VEFVTLLRSAGKHRRAATRVQFGEGATLRLSSTPSIPPKPLAILSEGIFYHRF
jgi:hypothetical protein